MSLRTTRHTATFNEPFSLQNVEGVQPAGEYNVFSEDGLITGLSRTVWRRVLTLIQTPSISSIHEAPRLVVIRQVELDPAPMKDQHLTISPGDVEKH